MLGSVPEPCPLPSAGLAAVLAPAGLAPSWCPPAASITSEIAPWVAFWPSSVLLGHCCLPWAPVLLAPMGVESPAFIAHGREGGPSLWPWLLQAEWWVLQPHRLVEAPAEAEGAWQGQSCCPRGPNISNSRNPSVGESPPQLAPGLVPALPGSSTTPRAAWRAQTLPDLVAPSQGGSKAGVSSALHCQPLCPPSTLSTQPALSSALGPNPGHTGQTGLSPGALAGLERCWILGDEALGAAATAGTCPSTLSVPAARSPMAAVHPAQNRAEHLSKLSSQHAACPRGAQGMERQHLATEEIHFY